MAENLIDERETTGFSADVSPASEDEEGFVDFVSLFQTLRRGRRTILAVSLGALLLATVVAFFVLDPLYTSSASFVPPSLSSGNSMSSAIAGQLTALATGDALSAGKTSGDLYAGILRSQSVASGLVARFYLMRVYRVKKESQAEKRLASNTDIGVDAKSSIVTVEVTDKSPALARDL